MAKIKWWEDPKLFRPQNWLMLGAILLTPLTLILPIYQFEWAGGGGFALLGAKLTTHNALAHSPAAKWLGMLQGGVLSLSALLALWALMSFRRLAWQKSLLQGSLALALTGGLLAAVVIALVLTSEGASKLNLSSYPGWGLFFLPDLPVLYAAALVANQKDQQRLKAMNRFW